MRPADLALVASVRADLASGRASAARKTAGITQSEVAPVLGVSRQAVSQWESGSSVPSAVHALAYAKLLRQINSYRPAA